MTLPSRSHAPPVGKLGAHRENPFDELAGRRHADQKTANAVGGHQDVVTLETDASKSQYPFEVLAPPIKPAGPEAAHAFGPGAANPAVVVGNDVKAVGVEKIGKSTVVPALHRSCRIDDDNRRQIAAIFYLMNPGVGMQWKSIDSGNVYLEWSGERWGHDCGLGFH